jgi:hypothetical protein
MAFLLTEDVGSVIYGPARDVQGRLHGAGIGTAAVSDPASA